MQPKLAELIAYCREHGIKGSYNAKHDPPYWRAKVRVGMTVYSVPADTREEALERAAETALRNLRDPMPELGSRAYVAWRQRRGG